ncbi:cupin domain-containing protein [Sphingobacterium sp. ML3W]|uniref:cupin domain-containing protein n=1 Tax=Sphingobacterium sp. ML3W TaxID=1538644 RepID=UPI00249B6AD9|nr:cupin domain-containing protein [Sphingobacterium sp. ML3W]WFA80850.1 cupin domain-containing protein [Sphingobacterium sp. ML3W]
MIEIVNGFEILGKVAKDALMMQKVAHLIGEDTMSLFIIELSKNQKLPAHYHKAGIEMYFILSGEGSIETALFKEETNVFENVTTQTLKPGDAFTIHPLVIHQLVNEETGMLKLLAVAPKSHNNEDRYFVDLGKKGVA